MLEHFFINPYMHLQMAQSQNKVFLSGNSLMLNIQDSAFDDASERLKGKK